MKKLMKRRDRKKKDSQLESETVSLTAYVLSEVPEHKAYFMNKNSKDSHRIEYSGLLSSVYL